MCTRVLRVDLDNKSSLHAVTPILPRCEDLPVVSLVNHRRTQMTMPCTQMTCNLASTTSLVLRARCLSNIRTIRAGSPSETAQGLQIRATAIVTLLRYRQSER